MNHLVKIQIRDMGDRVDKDNQVWCLVLDGGSGRRAACSGEYFGDGESDCVYIEKSVKRGGIDCCACLALIKSIKGVKL